MSKFLFLCPIEIDQDDLKIIHSLGSVLMFSDINLTKSVAELFALYDVIILDINKYKDYYASYKLAVRDNPNAKCIYMYPKHVKVDGKVQEKLRAQWFVDSLLKSIPSVFANKADLVAKILAGHLPSVDVPITESCLKEAVLYIGKKIGCVKEDP